MKVLSAILAIIGVLAIVVSLIAQLENLSYEEVIFSLKKECKAVFHRIWEHIKARCAGGATPIYVPDEGTVKKVIDSVAVHSLLSPDDTLWELNLSGAFPVITVQILPQNDHSVIYAEETAKTIVGNVARTQGIAVDIASECVPSISGALSINIGIASTPEHKAALGEYRKRKNQQAILDASGNIGDFIDKELNDDIADYTEMDGERHDF